MPDSVPWFLPDDLPVFFRDAGTDPGGSAFVHLHGDSDTAEHHVEWVPIVLIILPILLPLIDQLGFNLTWFGILVAVNLQTVWLSPPVVLSAYFLKGVVP